MSDYTSKRALVDSIMKNVLITTEEGFELRGEIVDLIKNQPTLDEKEIIRKYGEQILDAFYGKHAEYRRLSEQANIELPQECYYSGHTKGFEEAIKIVKEECGINE